MADGQQLSLQTHNLRNSASSPNITSAPVFSTVSTQAFKPRSSSSSMAVSSVSDGKINATKKSKSASSKSRIPTAADMIAGEITYTPTTHRISKAKKGKKVHACEFPGCPKIFTRAEHRKRHEANHNTHPAFQCQVDDCKKPFQRADLLARHMERQHNIPADPALRSQYSRSTNSASPSLGHLGVSTYGRHAPTAVHAFPPGPSAMSIGSIIESDRFGAEYHRNPSAMHHGLPELSTQTAIGTAPRSLQPEMLYGFASAGDSPLYSSSDSCYSPHSDYIQPTTHQHQQQQSHPAACYGNEIVRPQTVAAESAYQALVNSPVAAASPISVGPATPAWGPQYDPVTLGYAGDVSYVPPQAPLPYSAAQWTHAATIAHDDMVGHAPLAWSWATKVGY